MQKRNILQKNYTSNQKIYQLKLPFGLSQVKVGNNFTYFYIHYSTVDFYNFPTQTYF